MDAKAEFNVGDIVRMKKPHPCGSSNWEITRTGMDFGLRCCGCGHHVMIPRTKFVKGRRSNGGACFLCARFFCVIMCYKNDIRRYEREWAIVLGQI